MEETKYQRTHKAIKVIERRKVEIDLSIFQKVKQSVPIDVVRNLPGWEDALPVKYGNYVYNVSSRPYVYHNIAKPWNEVSPRNRRRSR